MTFLVSNPMMYEDESVPPFIRKCLTPIDDAKSSPTVGSKAVELMAKGDQRQGVVDTQREMTKGYIDELIKCAQSGSSAYGKEKPFYVCVQTRRERLLCNVIRNQFYHRITRPTPAYDLALYWYDPKEEELRFVWCIPDKQTVDDMVYPGFVPSKEDSQLYDFVKSFVAGTLI